MRRKVTGVQQDWDSDLEDYTGLTGFGETGESGRRRRPTRTRLLAPEDERDGYAFEAELFTEGALEEAFVGAGDLVREVREKCEDGRLGLDLGDVVDPQVVTADGGRRDFADLFE